MLYAKDKDRIKKRRKHPFFFFSLLSFFIASFSISGCALQDKQSIIVLNSAEFSTFTQVMPEHVQSRELVDSEGYWYAPLLSLPISGGGKELFENLETSFLSISTNSNYKEVQERNTKTLGQDFPPFALRKAQNINIATSFFTCSLGTDLFKGELIAKLDWTQDGKDDWLILFTLKASQSLESSRIYYLLIRDFENLPYRAEVLAVRSLADKHFTLFVDKNPAYQAGFISEIERGEVNIIEENTYIPVENIQTNETKLLN